MFFPLSNRRHGLSMRRSLLLQSRFRGGEQGQAAVRYLSQSDKQYGLVSSV